MRSTNPILGRSDSFTGTSGDNYTSNPYEPYGYYAPVAERMTMDHVVVRTGMCLGLLVAFAAGGWVVAGPFDNPGPAVLSALVAFVLYLVIMFKRSASPALILPYAAFEGLFLGAVSHAFNAQYPGIVLQAVIGTFGVFAGTLALYQTRIIRVTERYARLGLAIAFGFIVLILANLLFSAFGAGDGLGLYSGNTGLLFGALGVALGGFFLSLDFAAVESGIARGVPERNAWVAAFGLTLSLVWIYTYLLRILAILNNRN